MNRENCVFCEIVRGTAEASVVFEDDNVVAFLDINPVTDGHLLVVAREHAVTLDELEASTLVRMVLVARDLAHALRRSGIRCEGINLFYADGEAAFQTVFHSHLHVIPRYQDDGFRLDANVQFEKSRTALDFEAAQIRSALEAD